MAPATPAQENLRINRVEMCNIIKRFPGVLANDKVCFDVNAGEVHALLGENGAGKSTLMRQLYGMYRPDAGDIMINGLPYVFNGESELRSVFHHDGKNIICIVHIVHVCNFKGKV